MGFLEQIIKSSKVTRSGFAAADITKINQHRYRKRFIGATLKYLNTTILFKTVDLHSQGKIGLKK